MASVLGTAGGWEGGVLGVVPLLWHPLVNGLLLVNNYQSLGTSKETIQLGTNSPGTQLSLRQGAWHVFQDMA